MEYSSDDGDSKLDKFEENEIIKEKIILENRPGFAVPLPTAKGGIKYAEYKASEEEKCRLQAYYDANNTILSSWKVRKLANLGQAEWIPELGVAKILKQRKFMQTNSHLHEKGFMALHAEECLFLLDVGDIELYYKGMALSMQDAYALLLCDKPDKLLCTLDEYQVYAYLCRIGYRVQRYCEHPPSNGAFSNSVHSPSNCSIPVEQSKNIKKRILEEDSQLQNHDNEKRTRTTDSDIECTETTAQNVVNTESSNNEHRNWWLSWWIKTKENSNLNKSKFQHCCRKCNIPNFGEFQTIVLKFKDRSTLPMELDMSDVTLPSIWHERIKKQDKNETLFVADDYSHPKHVGYPEICRKANNWRHYKELVATAIKVRDAEMKNLHNLMNSGETKPLTQPNRAHSTKHILDQLNIFTKTKDRTSDSLYNKIKFNVFQPDNVKPFRRTKPGTPFLRIIVADSWLNIPSLTDICGFQNTSDGVPVKVALVRLGKPLFFGFDNIDIPTDVWG